MVIPSKFTPQRIKAIEPLAASHALGKMAAQPGYLSGKCFLYTGGRGLVRGNNLKKKGFVLDQGGQRAKQEYLIAFRPDRWVVAVWITAHERGTPPNAFPAQVTDIIAELICPIKK